MQNFNSSHNLRKEIISTNTIIEVLLFVAAQVNPNMPRTFGDGIIHESHCDVMVSVTSPLGALDIRPVTDVELKIGKLIAENLISDEATLQTGTHFVLTLCSVQ